MMKARFRFWVLLLCVAQSPWVAADGVYTLYREALVSDPALNIARAGVQVGEARFEQTTSQLLPQISLSSTGTENERKVVSSGSEQSYTGERHSLVLRQKLFDLNAWYNRERYQALSTESEYRLRAAEVELGMDLVIRYLDVLAKQDALELVTAEKQAMAKQLAQLKRRYERQLATLTDLLEVEARLDSLVSDEIAARADVSIALEGLSERVGRTVSGPLPPINEEIGSLGDLLTLEHWTGVALKNNPTLQALNLKMQSEEAALRQARAVDYPVLDVTLTAQRSDIGYENTPTTETETYVAAINLTVPIYQGGNGSARKAEARGLLQIAQLKQEEGRRQMMKGLRAAYLTTEANEARMGAARKAVASASKSYEARRKGFDYGTVTVVNVLDALRDQYQMRKNFRQAQYDYLTSWLQLLGMAGVLEAGHIEQINGWQRFPAAG